MKKLTSILLALLMALTLLPTAVFAEETGSETKTESSVAYVVGGLYYDALDTAVASVANSGTATIKLLQSATGNGFVVDGSKTIIIDFGGFAYTISGLVGSAGTETNGLQLFKDSTVTLKNGKLKVADSVKDEAASLVQNYCNFTAEDMIFDGTNLMNPKQAYVLSNNNGKINVIGCTIKTPERANAYALDAAIWGTYEGADVTAENCTIYGKMEVAEWDKNNVKVKDLALADGLPLLTLKNCTVTDLASAMLCAADDTTITLAGDVTLTEMVTLNKNLTIDLNGHKLSRNGGNSIVQVINNKTLTINGTTEKSEVYGRINVGIGTNNNGNVVLNGGTYSCGKGENEAGQTVLHINGTCHDSDVTITNATITSPNDNAIQLNGGGTFLVENSTITGATAVYIKSGNLTVKGSTLIGNKSPVNYSYNGNGADATGDGMVIDSCDYPAGAPTVTIENTNVTGSKAAVGTYEILQADKAASHKAATVSLKSGTFTSANNNPSVSTTVTGEGITASNITITGGTFSTNPAEYVNNTSYAVTKVADSKYTVGASTGTSSVVLPTTGGSESSTSTSASIPASDIDANKELVVGTGTTSVTFNSAAAASIKTKGDLTLTVTTKDGKNSDNVTDTNKAAYIEATKSTSTTNAVVVSIDLTKKNDDGSNSNVFTEKKDGAYAIVTVPYKAGMKNVTVHHLGADGVATKLDSATSADLTTNNTFYYDSTTGVITMRLPHFSQYLINGTVSSSYVKRWDSSAATTSKAQSPTTFDAGIAIYGVMAVSSVLGMGYMGKKKFF